MRPEDTDLPITPAVCRSPWSHAAALGACGLSGLQAATLATRPDAAAYLTVLLAVGALAAAVAGFGLGRRNGVVSRMLAVVVSVTALGGVGLLMTVGGPGGDRVPGSVGMWTALGLAGAVLSGLAGDAARRRHRAETA